MLIWLHLPYIFSLCRLMSSDRVNAFVSHSLSLMQTLFQLWFSYSCRQKVVFPASLLCMPVTGILPALCAELSVGMHVCVCVFVSVCAFVCASLSLCLCMCEYFSEVEAAFMSVPSVENGSVSEGQPLVLHWASHSVPKSQMPLSDVESLLFVHETTAENILYLWDQMNDLLHTSMRTGT